MNHYKITIICLVFFIAFNFFMDTISNNHQTKINENAIEKWELQVKINDSFINTHKQLWKGIFG